MGIGNVGGTGRLGITPNTGVGRWPPLDIAAYGDSLTGGAGATAGHSYPAVAAGLFSPPRDILNFGVPGQTARQVVSRQGGLPVTISVAGDQVPAYSIATKVLTFDAPSGDYTPFLSPALAVTGGRLVVTADSAYDGVVFAIPPMTSGQQITVTADLSDLSGNQLVLAGLVRDNNWANSGIADYQFTAGGRVVMTLTAPADASNYVVGFIKPATGGFALDNVTLPMEVIGSADLTARSVSPVTYYGPLVGSARALTGTIGGQPVILSRAATPGDDDNDGAVLSVRRVAVGSAISAPANSVFVPDQSGYKNRILWLWVGRNPDALDAVNTKAAIAAAVSALPHRYFLIGGVTTAAAALMNADLAALYGRQFVDLYAILRQHGDGSANDNADIAAGLIPRSLRSDDTHLNDVGYAVVAQAFYSRTMAFS